MASSNAPTITGDRSLAVVLSILCVFVASSSAFSPAFSPRVMSCGSRNARICTAPALRSAPSPARSAFTGSSVSFLRTPRASALTSPRMAVDVTVSDIPNSQKKLEITVSADECNNAFQAVLTKLSKTTTIPGFRKGKAPPNIVLNHYGKQSVSAEAVEEIIGASVPLALQQNDIKAIGQAKMANDNQIAKILETFKPGNPVTFEVVVDVWPQPKLTGPYTGMDVTAEEETFEDDLVMNALQEMRKRESFSILSGADTVATVTNGIIGDETPDKLEGAVAVVDLKGFRKAEDGSKGDALPDLAIGENVEVVMETGKFFEGFVESIAGLKAGDEKTVPVTFPANHKVPELRGLEALFDVTIKGLKDRVFPTLDDEFAKKVSKAKDLAELKEMVRQSVTKESLMSTEKNVNKALEDKMINLIDVEIPETLVDEQTKTKFAQMMSDFKTKGMDDEAVKNLITKENFDKYKSNSRDNTVRALKVSFVIGEIARAEGIKVDQSEIESEMASLRQAYQGEEIDEEQAKNRVEAELERGKVLEFLRANNNINLVPKKDAPAKAE